MEKIKVKMKNSSTGCWWVDTIVRYNKVWAILISTINGTVITLPTSEIEIINYKG